MLEDESGRVRLIGPGVEDNAGTFVTGEPPEPLRHLSRPAGPIAGANPFIPVQARLSLRSDMRQPRATST